MRRREFNYKCKINIIFKSGDGGGRDCKNFTDKFLKNFPQTFFISHILCYNLIAFDKYCVIRRGKTYPIGTLRCTSIR